MSLTPTYPQLTRELEKLLGAKFLGNDTYEFPDFTSASHGFSLANAEESENFIQVYSLSDGVTKKYFLEIHLLKKGK